jgi:hypothetical protein
LIDLAFYEVDLIHGIISVSYKPKAKFKKEKVISPLRDFLLEHTTIKNFSSDYELKDHLSYIFEEKILTSEENIKKLIEILEGE